MQDRSIKTICLCRSAMLSNAHQRSTRLSNVPKFSPLQLGPMERSPELGGDSATDVLGNFELGKWLEGGSKIPAGDIMDSRDSAEERPESLNEIMLRGLRGEDTLPPFSVDEQAALAEQQRQAEILVSQAGREAVKRARAKAGKSPPSLRGVKRIAEETASIMENEVKDDLVKILKPVRPMSSMEDYLALPPNSGVYTHPDIEKARSLIEEHERRLRIEEGGNK